MALVFLVALVALANSQSLSSVAILKPPRGYSIFLGMYGETTPTRFVATRGVIGNGGRRLRPR